MIKYDIEKHGVSFPSKCLATEGGAHILNIKVSEDVDNGWFVGKGAYVSLDLYAEAAPTAASLKVVEKAANGNFYCEVVSTDNAYLVSTVPMIAEDYNSRFKKESNFFNEAKSVVRAYELKPMDIIELSAEAFSATPSVGSTVTLQAISGATAMQLG